MSRDILRDFPIELPIVLVFCQKENEQNQTEMTREVNADKFDVHRVKKKPTL